MRHMIKELMTRVEAAHYMGVQPETLEVWASTKRYNLTFIKVGRYVRYRKSDIDKFLKKHTVQIRNL